VFVWIFTGTKPCSNARDRFIGWRKKNSFLLE
jgi:hypothetical protein